MDEPLSPEESLKNQRKALNAYLNKEKMKTGENKLRIHLKNLEEKGQKINTKKTVTRKYK